MTLAPLNVFSCFTVPTLRHDGHGGGGIGVMGLSGNARRRLSYTDSRARFQPVAGTSLMHVSGTFNRLGLIPFAASFGPRATNRSLGSFAIAMHRDALQTQTFRTKGEPPGGAHESAHGVCCTRVICATTQFDAVRIDKHVTQAASERVVETRALQRAHDHDPVPLQNRTPTAGCLES